MKKEGLKEVAVKTLWLSGGALRLALGSLGASLAAFLLIEKFRHRRHRKHVLPYQKIKEALKR